MEGPDHVNLHTFGLGFKFITMSDDRFLQKFPKYNSSEIATGGSQFGPKMKRQDGSIPEIHAEGVLDIWTRAHMRT